MRQAEFQELFLLFSDPEAPRGEVDAAITRIYPLLLAAAGKILGSPRFRSVDCDPEAAVQEWFHNMLVFGLAGYDRVRPFYVYGYRALVNICHSFGRRAKRRQTQPLDFEIAARVTSPSGEIEKAERRLYVRRSIRRLPKQSRQALILKYWLGKSSAEAASRLGLTPAQVNGRNHVSRQLLTSEWTVKELLEDYHST